MRNNENPGYHFGLFVSRLLAWYTRMAEKARQRGMPRWVIRHPRF